MPRTPRARGRAPGARTRGAHGPWCKTNVGGARDKGSPTPSLRRRPHRLAALGLRASWLALPLGVWLALCATGCTTLAAYDGPRRSRGEVAELSAAIIPGIRISIESVDGRAPGFMHGRIEVLPGLHRVSARVVVSSWRRQLDFAHELALETEPGRTYMLYAEVDAYGPRSYIVDQDRLEIVAEAKGPPLRPDRGVDSRGLQ